MSNNSPEFWSIDGISLHQFGWSVATLGGSRFALPELKGGNIEVAYRPGKKHRHNKLPDERVTSLIMWMTGTDPATGLLPEDDNARVQWNNNWNALRRLVWKPNGTQVTLTRRWELTDPITELPVVVVASAQAQIFNTMEPEMQGRARSTFSIDLVLADPYFYGDEVEEVIPLSTPTTVNNPGDDIASFYGMQVDFVGSLTNPILVNSSTSPDIDLRLISTTIGSGSTVTLDMNTYTIDPVAVPLGNVRRTGARAWFGLFPGDNVITLTASGGSGHAVVRYRPVYV